MATHKSAIKRARQSEKRKLRNKAAMSTMKTLIKKVQTAIEGKNTQDAGVNLKEATSYIDKIADKGIIHKNRASRIVSRLNARINKAAAQ
ncbi:MAG: 30S ribosomal protein S20 [Nitrospirae bacterium]|nr:30S ribosomal protein S20 [Nitrospirota bacterium]